MRYYFDMDGTFVDFYGVTGWQTDLQKKSTRPYKIARPLRNLNTFAKKLNKLQSMGDEIYIVSWASKDADKDFYEEIKKTKEKYLKKHLGSVHWNGIHILEYGTPKSQVIENGYTELCFLIDDELENLREWRESGNARYGMLPVEIDAMFEMVLG